MVDGARKLSIIGAEKESTIRNFLTRAFLKTRSYHSFLALVDETEPDNPKVIEEIHFLPLRKSGSNFNQTFGSYVSSTLNVVLSMMNLCEHFKRAVDSCGAGEKLYRLKYKSVKPQDRDLSSLGTVPYFSGDEEAIHKVWNKAKQAAGYVDSENILFVFPHTRATLDSNYTFQGTGAVNCRAGVIAVLSSMGVAFRHAVDPSCTRRGMTTNLARWVPGLKNIDYSDCNIDDLLVTDATQLGLWNAKPEDILSGAEWGTRPYIGTGFEDYQEPSYGAAHTKRHSPRL